MPRLDHINIKARDPKVVRDFLEAVVGVREGFRPPFKHPGHWLYLDGLPVIHLDYADRTDDPADPLVNHIAFGVYDYDPLLERVKATGCRYDLAGIPDGVGQIFVHGPEGLRVELQFYR